MEFKEFAKHNRARCESRRGFRHKIDNWSLSDWITAVCGELGEAANFAKKINRIRDELLRLQGKNSRGETRAELYSKMDALHVEFKKEIADTFIYLDILSQSQGFSLEDAVIAKFNEKSKDIGYPVVIGE